VQPRRNDARVVEHHQIAGTQFLREVGHAPVTQRAGCAVQAQQAAGAALRQRVLRDQFRRQGVMEIGAAHGPMDSLRADGGGKYNPRRTHVLPEWRNW
jgi:hypothetical protein